MDYEQTVSRLCGLPGPSGFEFEAAADAAEMLRPFVDEVMVDHMYSVIGVRRCGKKGAPKLLLDAHLDEVGYIVTGHKDGYLTFTSLGGVDPRILPNQELTLLTDPPLPGIVACLMFSAHMDAIGLIVTHIEKNGKKRISPDRKGRRSIPAGHRLYAGSVSERSARGDRSGGKGGIWDTETG